MNDHKYCPECDSRETTKRNREEHNDTVIILRTCDNCMTQWRVVYGNPIVENVTRLDEIK